MQLGHRWYVTASVGLVGAGVIAVTPVAAPLSGVHVPDIQLTAGEEAQDIVIDIVRHGQRMPPFDHYVTPSPAFPGAPLSDLGQQQAQDVGHQLFSELGGPHGVAGIFSGQGIRDMDTAAPFADLENMNVQILPGLDEIDSGIYAHDPDLSLGGILYELTPFAWGAGLELVPMPGSSYVNGVVFEEKFNGAIDTMYNDAMANPVVSDNGQITDVAFNNEGSVTLWVLTNVKNPDLPFFLHRVADVFTAKGLENAFLPNTGVVEVKGNPEDGWTLISFDGHPIPQDPDLLSALFVDFRDLITPPQTRSGTFGRPSSAAIRQRSRMRFKPAYKTSTRR